MTLRQQWQKLLDSVLLDEDESYQGGNVGKFEVFEDRAGQFRWRLRAANNKVVAQSEGYTRIGDAKRSCAAVMAACVGAKMVDLVK